MFSITVKKVLIVLGVLSLGIVLRCDTLQAQNTYVKQLKDSLHAVQFLIPLYPQIEKRKIIIIRTQEQWEGLGKTLVDELRSGECNLEFRIQGKDLILPQKPRTISNVEYPNARVRIVNNGGSMLAEGVCYKRSDGYRVGRFWTVKCDEWDIDNIIVDSRGNELSLRNNVFLVNGNIEFIKDDIWRFKTDLPDLQEDECNDFFILMTRDWTSARHKVIKVNDGWLYYHLNSKDYQSERDPNVDWIQYHVRPRCTLINYPNSSALHIKDGKIYVPWKYKKIRICKGGYLLHMGNCCFKSFEVTGFKLNGLSICPIGVYHSKFIEGLFIYGNSFTNLSSMAVNTAWCENVIFSSNFISYSRTNAIECSGLQTTICRNRLSFIGWMLNSRAIVGGGEQVHICDNVIDNFNYSAISCGTSISNDKAKTHTYIIERNTIRLTKEYLDNYLYNTLADGGGIYTGPQCTWGIIRNNVIQNIKGIHSNRGIFLDDGAKNLAIYGNYVVNTDNSYDIDLRLTKTYADGIPDHNTNNSIFQNILTGGYRFEDAGEGSNCIGGENILLGTGQTQKTVVKLQHRVADETKRGVSLGDVVEKYTIDTLVKGKILKK